MTNSQKYKTSEERDNAFIDFCDSYEECEGCPLIKLADSCGACLFDWLDLEAEEDKNPLPCPFCGMELMTVSQDDVTDGYYVGCGSCQYRSPSYPTEHDVIVEHNRVARAVMKEKEGGVE